MATDYLDLSLKELRAECKERKLSKGGNKDELVDRLLNDDLAKEAKATGTEPSKASDPDPKNPNFDVAGRWRRRPRGWVRWAEDGSAVMEGDE